MPVLKQSARTQMPEKTITPGPPVLVESGRYRARSVRATDASQEIADWFADADRVGPLNMPPRKLSVQDLRRFFASFDNRRRFLVALIDKADDRLTGFFHAEFNALHRTSIISFLNGPNTLAARRAMAALGRPLIKVQFVRYGIEKIGAQVPVANVALCTHLDRLGFQREGYLRSQVRAPGGTTRLDQVLFGLLPQDLEGRR